MRQWRIMGGMRFVETSVFTAVLHRHLDDERYRHSKSP